MTEPVRSFDYDAPCPCGRDAKWIVTETKGVQTTRIECPCDWSFTQQRARMNARRALLDQPQPKPAPTPQPRARRWSLATFSRRTA